MEIASNETIKQAVAAGFGVGFLSSHCVEQEIALGKLVVLHVRGFPVMRQWYVVHTRGRRLPRIAEAFARFLIENGARLIRTTASANARQPRPVR
jgi:DNA-binding transcriptional LysR family regulator